MAWVESHDEIWDHWKLMKLCEATGLEDTNAVGKLHSLWHFTLRNAWRDANLEAWGDDGIERAARWRGQQGLFIGALRACGFMDNFTVRGFLKRAGRLVYDRLRNERRKSTAVKRRTSGGKYKATVPYPTLPYRTVPNQKNNTLAQAPKRSKVFQKPTAQEVKDYAASIGFRLDGEAFCAHYEARGWKYGPGRPMVSWQAAVVTWKKGAPATAMIPPDKPKAIDAPAEDLVSHEDVSKLVASLKGKGMP